MQWPKEHEIVEKLAENFRAAAQHAYDLAKFPSKGPRYLALRTCLREIEDCARLVAYYRQDARWLQIGMAMGLVHQKTGDWIRAHVASENFRQIGDWLWGLHQAATSLQLKATGRQGMILPKPKTETRTQGRPVQVKLPEGVSSARPSGLLIPLGAKAA